MDIFIPALWIASGINLFAGTQFIAISLLRRYERVYQAFGILCLLLSVYLVFSAQWYGAASVESAGRIVRAQMAIACLVYPVFVWFLGLYTGHQSFYKVLAVFSVIYGVLFIVNIDSPYSFLIHDLETAPPIVLPWGETVSNFKMNVSRLAWLHYLSNYSIFLWSFIVCLSLWKRGEKPRAISISVYLFLQMLVIFHAQLVDNLNLESVYLGELVFLILVVHVTFTLIWELRGRSRALEKSIEDLRMETEQREKYQKELSYLAHHDHLTSLPNRHALTTQLDSVLVNCSNTNSSAAMLLIDLDHFKNINDSLGHDLGDELLQMVARRLDGLIPATSRPIRLGGDEFAVFCSGLSREQNEAQSVAIEMARRVRKVITKPYRIAEHELVVGASIGISIFDETLPYLSDIMKRADMALYKAKSVGRNSIEVFAPSLKKVADQRLVIDKGMRLAIENGDIELYFQPQVDTNDRLVGAEVLSRWRHPDYGEIAPAQFIKVAEETGLIHSLGDYVLLRACQYLVTWDASLPQSPANISINVSPWQLDNPGFTKRMMDIIEETGVDTSRIILEITESTFMRDIASVSAKLKELSEAGITFSIDDFGTGYSTLALLKDLAIHELKIDKSFVHGMSHEHNKKLIETIVAIARLMDLRIVAEGVETNAQQKVLISLGCDIFQGFLFGRPLPKSRFVSWMESRRTV